MITCGLGPAMNTNRCHMGEMGHNKQSIRFTWAIEMWYWYIGALKVFWQIRQTKLFNSWKVRLISLLSLIINYAKPPKNSIPINNFRSVSAFYSQL